MRPGEETYQGHKKLKLNLELSDFQCNFDIKSTDFTVFFYPYLSRIISVPRYSALFESPHLLYLGHMHTWTYVSLPFCNNKGKILTIWVILSCPRFSELSRVSPSSPFPSQLLFLSEDCRAKATEALQCSSGGLQGSR